MLYTELPGFAADKASRSTAPAASLLCCTHSLRSQASTRHTKLVTGAHLLQVWYAVHKAQIGAPEDLMQPVTKTGHALSEVTPAEGCPGLYCTSRYCCPADS
jgi:hypothetical protein